MECEGVCFGVPMKGSGGSAVTARVANESIGQWDLVEMVGTNRVQRSRGGSTSQIVGLSLDNYSAGQVCMISMKGGRAKNLTNTGIGGQGTLLKPDPNNIGGVIATTDPTDASIIGRVYDGLLPAGSDAPVHLTLG
jgi:hypothetical protein